MMNSAGSLHVPLCICFVATSIMALGLLGLMHDWKELTKLQIKMDRCTGKAALNLKEDLNNLENSNAQIKVVRASLLVPILEPATRAALVTALNALMLRQEAILMQWRAFGVTWVTQQNCKAAGVLSWPYPMVPFIRPPPDPLGPQPLSWTDNPNSIFRLVVRSTKRQSLAEVYREETNGSAIIDSPNWRAKWSPFFSWSGAT